MLTFKERFNEAVNQQVEILVNTVHRGEALPEDILAAPRDYMDSQILGKFRKNPIAKKTILKRFREAFHHEVDIDLSRMEEMRFEASDNVSEAYIQSLRGELADVKRELLAAYRALKLNGWRYYVPA